MWSEMIPELRERLGQVADLNAAIALLQWDQEVCMPAKGAQARGRQLATLSALAHRMFTDARVGTLLNELRATSTVSPDDRVLVDESLRDYERATKLPEAFVERFAEEQSRAYEAWTKARERSDFTIFQPHLETMFGLLRQKADYLGYVGSPYNALLDEYERGMTVEQLDPIFSDLAQRQSALVSRIASSGAQPDNAWLEGEWDANAQWALTLGVLGDMGYDFEAGRQDKSVHPFSTSFDLYDVRVTTRVNPKELFSALTGSMHEGGHALYEQGFREEDRRTPLAQGTSMGMHESQSRMWENMIGRSRPFWEHYAPAYGAQFPGRLDNVSTEQMFRAINRVEPSFIRVEADECTYNLHIILRYELETALIEGRMKVSEAPEAWNAKMKQYLGLEVPNDAVGCLQDIHWSHGLVGYFPTYALGNLYAAQLFEAMSASLPDIWGQVEAGNFGGILGWLRTHVHVHGRRKTATDIVRTATGREPSSEPFMRYLTEKYSALYRLS